MSAQDRARSGRSAGRSRGILSTVALVLLAYAVLGAVAGVVWELVWTPPGQVIEHHQVFYDSYASLRRVFTGTGLYAIVAAVAGVLLGLAVALLSRGRELLVLALVIVGSAIAAGVMWRVGTLLGPSDPASLAAHATGRTTASGELTVAGKSPFLVWPMASLLMVALVYFASPGQPTLPTTGGTPPTDHREADVPATPRG
jgi:hypothetical protein